MPKFALATLTVFALIASGCSWINKEIHGSSSGSEHRMQSAAPRTESSMTANRPVAEDTVKQVQNKLHDEDLYHGPVDGRWGPATKAALHDFQAKHDLDQSGELDKPTMDALDLH